MRFLPALQTERATARGAIGRLTRIGHEPSDSDELRAQKVTATLAACAVTVLSVAWVGTYLLLGLPVAAAIPFGYQVASIVGQIEHAVRLEHQWDPLRRRPPAPAA